MNKLLKQLITLSIIFLLGAAVGYTIKQTTATQEQFKVSKVLYESTNDFYLDPNDIGIEFSNGSYAIVNQDTNTYIFQSAELGDWDMTFNSLQELENCIKTYASIKNNNNY